MALLEVASRSDFNESLMLESFGDKYREYMKKNGTMIPVLHSRITL